MVVVLVVVVVVGGGVNCYVVIQYFTIEKSVISLNGTKIMI